MQRLKPMALFNLSVLYSWLFTKCDKLFTSPTQILKGHTQLMHMCTKYHFLADFLSQDACETKAYPEYSKQTLWSWTSYKLKPKPHQNTHFWYTIENSPMDFSREAKHRRILPNLKISRGEKLHKVWVIVLCARFTVENAWFSKYM